MKHNKLDELEFYAMEIAEHLDGTVEALACWKILKETVEQLREEVETNAS